MTYLLISDPHYEDFSQFSNIDSNGLNSRLVNTINATKEAVAHLKRINGNIMFVAGDVFHRRGQLSPSVLNPVLDCYREIVESGIEVFMIPGNHDLESNVSNRLGSAITALESVGVKVINYAQVIRLSGNSSVVMIPWISDLSELVRIAEDFRVKESALGTKTVDLVIHAPVNEVLPSLKGHGLSPKSLSEMGYRFVFAGHYHHACEVAEGVYSIGALTHQSWSDVGSKAGYRIIQDTGLLTVETSSPKFIELALDESDEIDGNYVRYTGEIEQKDILPLKEELASKGALGVLIRPIKKTVVKRAVKTSNPLNGLDDIILDYCNRNGFSEAEKKIALEISKSATGD